MRRYPGAERIAGTRSVREIEVPDPSGSEVLGDFEHSTARSVPAVKPKSARQGVLIAVCTDGRLAALPDAPTTTEAGLPELKMDAWWAAVTLAGTPDAIGSASCR